jgi:hypothetical protein
MSTPSVTNTFVNGTTADANQVNTNFSEVVSFLDDNVVHLDGSRAMTGALVLGADGTASTHAVTKSQLDAGPDSLQAGGWNSATNVTTTTSYQQYGASVSFANPSRAVSLVINFSSVALDNGAGGSRQCQFQVSYSLDNGGTWTVLQATNQSSAADAQRLPVGASHVVAGVTPTNTVLVKAEVKGSAAGMHTFNYGSLNVLMLPA